MGLFGNKRDAIVDAGYAPVNEPGAIPVATPVPMAQASYLENTTGTIAKESTVITEVPQQQESVPSMNTAFSAANDPTLSRGPMMMRQCPHCHQESRTRVTTAPAWQTWVASGALCFVFWPIFWVPLVLDNCKDTSHYCVLCGNEVGKVSAFEDCCVTTRE
ncbi:LITAF-like zinc ribbon domain containing protein [Nitzschia inconspicua]|uniref:LITAF-like zinc ribbon domain containing protein n=1 Tax=Nitzschia inconspicua TaxID=303405 RepID=A0A9K3KK23_9STRA|nr:LITAF-like zinc ribbon domain containing protein [Nitzschia inconspicua]